MNTRTLTLAMALAAGLSATAAETRIAPDRCLVGTMYAPYAHTLYQGRDEWPADLKRIKEMGFECVHGFAEWSQIEKTRGVYDFSELDRLVELCDQNGLLCLVNVASWATVSVALPAWAEKEYRGRGLVNSEDDGIRVRTLHSDPCMDDPWYRDLAERYLVALAEHYRGDRRIAGWIIWGEPMLEGANGKPVCFCEHTLRAYRAWLKARYGTVAALNAAWSTERRVDYGSFDEVRPAVGAIGGKGGYVPWSDWCRFMPEHFAGHIQWADRIMKAHGATQPSINEMFCYPSGGEVPHDVWALGKSADIVGLSCYLHPGIDVEVAQTIAESVAAKEGKSTFVVEQRGGSSGYLMDHTSPDVNQMLSEVTQAFGLGSRGLMYWTWRPRLSDYGGSTLGLCRPDGSPLPRAFAAGDQAKEMTALGRRLSDARRRPEIAVFHATGARFASAENCAGFIRESEIGALRLCFDLHVTPQVVTDEMVAEGLPKHLKVLLMPFAYALDEATCAGIRRFVEAGGCVVADVNFAAKRTNGHLWRVCPGGGLDAVFGYVRDEFQYLDEPSQLPADNRYAVPFEQIVDLVTPTTAEKLYVDRGRPLILRNRFRKGSAYFLAYQAFAQYNREWGNVPFRELVRGALGELGVKPFALLPGRDDKPWPDVCVAELVRDDGSKILTFTNAGYVRGRKLRTVKKVEAVVPGAKAIRKFHGPGVDDVKAAGERVTFTLQPWQSVMIEAEFGAM